MNYRLQYNRIKTIELLIQKELEKFQMDFVLDNNQITFEKQLSEQELQQFNELLSKFNIEIGKRQDLSLVDQIKNAVDLLLNSENDARVNISEYLSNKLNYSYPHLSKTFSESTFASIEQYVILKKIEKIKEFLIHSNLTLTEISYRLNYSSVAHLSGQFKKVTGLNPTSFVKIMESKKETFQM